jgi:hypothetical protein
LQKVMTFAATRSASEQQDIGRKLATAIRGLAESVAASPVERDTRPVEDGQIVVVRSRVVETVGHVLGNMFQRIYHLIDVASATDAVTAGALDGTTRRLEDFLQLVIDYFSPVSVVLQHVAAAEVAQSLARQISDVAGCAVKIDAKLPAEARVLADPGRLARSFALLASRLQADAARESGLEVRVVGDATATSMRLTVTLPRRLVASGSSESEIRWAVAEKLLETHGGSLQELSMPSGEVLWEIVLLLQP